MDDMNLFMRSQIGKFRSEYQIPEYKLRLFQVREDQPFEEKKLKIPAKWKDPDAIKTAQENSDKLRND
jgi:hypothetical protein